MELTVLHLLLILIGVIILGYFGYKASEGFITTPAVNLSCVPTSTDASGSTTKTSGLGMDACGQLVSITSLLGLTGAPPTDNGSVSPYLQNVQNMVHSEFLSHALNVPDSTTNTSNTTIGPISETQGLASLKYNDANALQGIQKIVHNALLNQKGMTTGAQMAFLGQKAGSDTGDEEYEEDNSDSSSPSNYQGREYTKDCPKNSGKPDMSKYIRKDSIPCWGCNVE